MELQNLGGVAMAPASHVPGLISSLLEQNAPTPAFAVLALFVAGAAAADPAVRPEAIFAPPGLALLPQVQQRCFDGALDGSDSFGGIAPSLALRRDADLAPLLRNAAGDEPGPLAYRAPLLVLQGTADTTVVPLLTDLLFAQLCRAGATVRYEKYAGMQHDALVPASAPDAGAWIAARFGGVTATTTCGATPAVHGL